MGNAIVQVVTNAGPPGPAGPQGPAGVDGGDGTSGGGSSVDLTPYAPKASPAFTGSPTLAGSPLLSRATADTLYDALGQAAAVQASAVAAALAAIPTGAVAGTPSLRAIGSTATTVVAGNDARLTDARVPTSHHGTHEVGGTDRVYEVATVISAGSTAQAANFDSANAYVITLTSASMALTFLNPPATGRYGRMRIVFIQDGTGSRSVTWPGSVTWVTGSAPVINSTPGSITIVDFFTVNGGTTYYGQAPQSAVTLAGIGAASRVMSISRKTANYQVGTDGATDYYDTRIEVNSSTAKVVTFATGIPIGAGGEIAQTGTGQVSFAFSGVTAKKPASRGLLTFEQGSTVGWLCTNTNEITFGGDLGSQGVPQIVNVTPYNSGYGNVSSVPFAPTPAPVVGNLLIALLSIKAAPTTTGWTAIDTTTFTNGDRTEAYQKVATSGDTAPTFPLAAGTDPASGFLIEISNFSTSAPINAHSSVSNAATQLRSMASLTPTKPYCLAIFFARWDGTGDTLQTATVGGPTGTVLGGDAESAFHPSAFAYLPLDASLAAVSGLTLNYTGTTSHADGGQIGMLIAPAGS